MRVHEVEDVTVAEDYGGIREQVARQGEQINNLAELLADGRRRLNALELDQRVLGGLSAQVSGLSAQLTATETRFSREVDGLEKQIKEFRQSIDDRETKGLQRTGLTISGVAAVAGIVFPSVTILLYLLYQVAMQVAHHGP